MCLFGRVMVSYTQRIATLRVSAYLSISCKLLLVHYTQLTVHGAAAFRFLTAAAVAPLKPKKLPPGGAMCSRLESSWSSGSGIGYTELRCTWGLEMLSDYKRGAVQHLKGFTLKLRAFHKKPLHSLRKLQTILEHVKSTHVLFSEHFAFNSATSWRLVTSVRS